MKYLIPFCIVAATLTGCSDTETSTTEYIKDIVAADSQAVNSEPSSAGTNVEVVNTPTTTTPAPVSVPTPPISPVVPTPAAPTPVVVAPSKPKPVKPTPPIAPPVSTAPVCESTDVGIPFQGYNATVVSDADYAPSQLIDGCVDRAHAWSGDYGSIVTLDAGSVHQMQGVYLWSTFARMEWVRIESSADGIQWESELHAIVTKPVTGPVYYPFSAAGPVRFVRISGFGSEQNSWVNISEVRWSLSGYNVQGERVYRDNGGTSYQAVTHSKHQLFSATSDHAAMVASIRATCSYGQVPSFTDVTGSTDAFITTKSINGRKAYLINWDKYPRWDRVDDFTEGALEPFSDYSDYVYSQPDFPGVQEVTLCNLSGRADQWYGFTSRLQKLKDGEYVPNTSYWK